jgi:hypothetical protein
MPIAWMRMNLKGQSMRSGKNSADKLIWTSKTNIGNESNFQLVDKNLLKLSTNLHPFYSLLVKRWNLLQGSDLSLAQRPRRLQPHCPSTAK